METITMKPCGCKDHEGDPNLPADLEHFSRDASSKTGLSSWCKICQNKRYTPKNGGTVSMNDFMENSKGDLVHVKNVKEIDKLRDEFVNDLIPEANAVNLTLAKFKDKALSQIDAFVEMAANDHGETFGGKKGNLHLDSYNGKYRVEISIADIYTHNEQLLIGKKMIDAYLKTLTKDSAPELQTLVNHTFAVDKEGRFNYRKIMEMRQWDIKKNEWLKALEVALSGIVPCGSKSYLRFYERVGKEGKYRQIPLNFTAL